MAAEVIRSCGIRRAIDLRMPGEVDLHATSLLPWERHHIPLFAHIRPEWDQPPLDDPETTARRYFEMLHEGRSRLARILELIAECGSRPTLIHCHAGRDRTGIVIGCVLDLLDVADDEIAADYALSSAIDVPGGWVAKAETIRALLRLVRAEYGTTRQMVQLLGTSDATLERLESVLLREPDMDLQL